MTTGEREREREREGGGITICWEIQGSKLLFFIVVIIELKKY